MRFLCARKRILLGIVPILAHTILGRLFLIFIFYSSYSHLISIFSKRSNIPAVKMQSLLILFQWEENAEVFWLGLLWESCILLNSILRAIRNRSI